MKVFAGGWQQTDHQIVKIARGLLYSGNGQMQVSEGRDKQPNAMSLRYTFRDLVSDWIESSSPFET